MSKGHIVADAAVEWSPNAVSWIGEGRQVLTAGSLAEAAPRLPGRTIVAAISRRTAFIRQFRVPNVSKSEIRRALGVQIGQLFPIAADDLAFDFHLTGDVSPEGRLAIIVAMRASDLKALHEQAKAAGLRIVKVVPAAMGSPILSRALGFADSAVVHRTAEGLAVDLVAGGELRYSRLAKMPGSAEAIAAEIARTFAAAVVGVSPTIAAGALALPDVGASTDASALESLLDEGIDIDIETYEQARTRARAADAQRLRLALVLFGAAVILLVYQFLRWDEAQKSAESGSRKWKAESTRLKRLYDAQVAKANAANGLRATLDRAFHSAQALSDVLATASNSTPDGVWLTGFSLERGKTLSLRGTATKGQSVADYEHALILASAPDMNDGEAKPKFRDVKLVFANNTEIDNTPVVQFSISAFPTGNLPLIEPKKKGGKR